MISTNVDFFRASTWSNMSITTVSFCLEVFSGPMPGDDVFENPDFFTTSHVFNIQPLRDSLPVECVRLGVLAFETNIVVEYVNDSNAVIPLSDSVRELLVEQDGTATWFMLYASTANVPTAQSLSASTTMQASQILVGTVGDIGSGADLEVPNSEVIATRDFKCGDVTFNLV